MTSIFDLTKKECAAAKGYAIVLIVLHNYLHIVTPFSENEFSYDAGRITYLLENFSLSGVLSFAGWVGVSLFVFMSGYGLSLKYGESSVNYYSFIKNHLIKLWKLCLPTYFLYLLLRCAYSGAGPLPLNWKIILSQATFSINLLRPNWIDPGIYWFFGLICEFYFLFLPCRKLSSKTMLIVAVFGLVANYFVLYFADYDMAIWYRHNCIGWLPPFFLGMSFAKYKDYSSRYSNYMVGLVISMLLLALSLTLKMLAPLADIVSILFFLCLAKVSSNRAILYLGLISSSIFVVHPLVRLFIFNTFSFSANWGVVLLYLFLVLLFSWIHSNLIHK